MFLENLALALRSLWAHKMRSFLTTLGIIIGVGAVIAVVSVVQGMAQFFTQEIESLGSNSVIVEPYRPPGKEGDKLERIELTWADGQAVVRLSPAVQDAAPILQRFEPVKYGDRKMDYPIVGTTPVFQDLRNYYVGDGRFFTAIDDRERRKVAVIGHGIIGELKLPARPVGKDLRIGQHTYRIVGVMEPKGQILGQELDKFVLIPFATAVGVYGEDAGKRIALLVHVSDPGKVERASEEIRDILRTRHRLRSDQPDDFQVQSQKEILKTVSKVTDGITYVVAGVVSIALLVGGIGIMNIMLVSVTERTREIGVRKAVGARKSNILAQFIIEAIALALVGGIVGIVLGVGAGAGIAALIPGWPGAHVPLWAMVLSFAFASAVGLFFGIYPAAKAAALDPIESLRYE